MYLLPVIPLVTNRSHGTQIVHLGILPGPGCTAHMLTPSPNPPPAHIQTCSFGPSTDMLKFVSLHTHRV